MISADEKALICDLAETYGIMNYRGLPPVLVATLSVGLRANSRIKMKLTGMKVPVETMLMATIADRLGLLLWQNSKDGSKNRNRPKSILEGLLDDKKDEVVVFNSGTDFANKWEMIRREYNG